MLAQLNFLNSPSFYLTRLFSEINGEKLSNIFVFVLSVELALEQLSLKGFLCTSLLLKCA